MSDDPQGLSTVEARLRLARDGPNEVAREAKRDLFVILREVFEEPMILLLALGGLLYLLLGDLKEAIILIIFAMISVVITVVQEARTEKVLDALRDLSAPKALVIRDGERQRIDGAHVVRGDLLLVNEGERVAADARLLKSHDLMADESLLTGESVPVTKSPKDDQVDARHILSGTLITRGTALGEVIATGSHSRLGAIGLSLSQVEREPPRLQMQTRFMVKLFGVAALVFTLLTVVLYGLTRGVWLEAFLAGIAIGMTLLPEELPVVLTVFMAMGAWRISRARVMTRKASAIETLGSATVLCTDKTGTLTLNRMTLAQLRMPDGSVHTLGEVAEAESFDDLKRFGMLASDSHPVDPMERAFHAVRDDAPPSASLIHAFGLRPDLLAVTHVWDLDDEDGFTVAAKGAPEAIAQLCKLDEAGCAQMRRDLDVMAGEGLRVLGVARATWHGAMPDHPSAFDFTYLGLAGLADPLRAGVPQAVAECKTAGIRVVMITGDYPATALAIARQAGIEASAVISGTELEAIDDDTLRAKLRYVSVFARIMPQQKLRIVEALKANGEIVAMTGDGVNDAPSLKAAHIGVAMGGRGTDVAREAASIVLLDDDFASIVTAIRLGRRIYDNLRKAVCFIFAVHMPIAGLALLPLLFGLPILLTPVHIAFLEMVIDPVSSLVFEAEADEPNVMHRPPRDPQASLFSFDLILQALVQGLGALIIVVMMFWLSIHREMDEGEIRAICFFALVLSILTLVLVNRSFAPSLRAAFSHPNRSLLAVVGFVSLVLLASVSVPGLRDLFRFGPLHGDDLALVAGSGLFLLLGLEAVKAAGPLMQRLRQRWLASTGSKG
jgi:Ca2+-transporting ATPase